MDCSYQIELQTSDLSGAGTSANGVISLIGRMGEAGPFQMVNDGQTFQQGSLDTITLDGLPDLGPIQQVSQSWPPFSCAATRDMAPPNIIRHRTDSCTTTQALQLARLTLVGHPDCTILLFAEQQSCTASAVKVPTISLFGPGIALVSQSVGVSVAAEMHIWIAVILA